MFQLYRLSVRKLLRNLSSWSYTLQHERSSRLFEGEQRFYRHSSDTLKCDMNFGIYLPPRLVCDDKPCPVLYFLNGLEGSHEDFFKKSGFGRFASTLGICVVSPDTSPRNVCMPAHELIGEGSSFYLDAIQEPWSQNFQMFTYVTKELISLITNNFCILEGKQSISGFSMGGYGALICFLKNPGLYQSVSAFAAVCNPLKCKTGRIALGALIGNDINEAKKWDPTNLVQNYVGDPIEILLDQGTDDEYGKETLLPENLVHMSKGNKCVQVIFRQRNGYSHNHFYISTFIQEHMTYHAKYLTPNSC